MDDNELTMNARRRLWHIEAIANRVGAAMATVLFVKMYWFPAQAAEPDEARFWPCVGIALLVYGVVFWLVRRLSLPRTRSNPALDRVKESMRS
ncbi:MAG TPA: hypothetical protein VGV37_12125 [Aliidongia sp.]|uniref:hypothetical protein n=1 Tax=Aliidongia sp. TaxID=1914230 RepID=UPI002DDCF794|nr:hypothetical protein [Aliidongia sp.]HEV2675281.1 hypothetical protein [Aliidongia sp.]